MGANQVILEISRMVIVCVAVVSVFWIRRPRRLASGQIGTSTDPQLMERLDRIESAVNAVAVETERIAEGQRFTTKLLSGADLRSSEIISAQRPVSR